MAENPQITVTIHADTSEIRERIAREIEDNIEAIRVLVNYPPAHSWEDLRAFQRDAIERNARRDG